MRNPNRRKVLPAEEIARLLLKCGRRCCLCSGLTGDYSVKEGQLAHIDKNASNSVEANIAWLCHDHHREYDSIISQSKNITQAEILEYKRRLEEYISNNKSRLISSVEHQPLRWASIEIAEESSWFDIVHCEAEEFSLHSYSWTGANGEGDLPSGKICDPIFDVAVINNSASHPIVLSRIGVIAKRALIKLHGFPPPEPIGVSEHITIPFKWKVGEPQWATLTDPVYLPPGSPYRFKLRLGHFAKAVPASDAIISLACMVDQKVFESDSICLGA